MAFRMTGIAPAAAMVTWLSFIVRLVKARLRAAVHIHTSSMYSFVHSEDLFSSQPPIRSSGAAEEAARHFKVKAAIAHSAV